MDTKLEPIVQALQEKFSVSLEEFRNEVHVFVNPEQIVEALTLLRDKYDFELLSAMTAADVTAISCDLSIDIIGEKSIPAVARPGQWSRPSDPDRDRCI